MGAFEECILATPALIKKGTVINTLISSCLINKSVDPLTLLVGDKSAILLAVRNTGFGTDYKVKIQCSECKKIWKHNFNLKNLEYKFLSEEPDEVGKNQFTFSFTDKDDKERKIKFSLLTDGDDLDIAITQDNTRKDHEQEVDTTLMDRLKRQIISIDDIVDKKDVIDEIENGFSLIDLRKIRKKIRSIEPDVVFQEEVKCRFCGIKEMHPIPMGADFLWPSFND
jgi:hypothetical protein